MAAQITPIQQMIQDAMNAADRKAEQAEAERNPVKVVATKSGGTITLSWSKTLRQYVTIPE